MAAPFIDPWAALAEAKNFSRTLAGGEKAENDVPTGTYENFSHFSHFSRGPSAPAALAAKNDIERENKNPIFYSENNDLDFGSPPGMGGDKQQVQTSAATPAKAAKAAKVDVSAGNHSTFTLARPAAAVAKLEGLNDWYRRLEALPAERDPCPGFYPVRWSTVRAACFVFIEQFGSQADALEWTALDLFGVHPEVGAVRLDYCGALLLTDRSRITAISAEDVVYGGHLRFRRRFTNLDAVPLWSFGSR